MVVQLFLSPSGPDTDMSSGFCVRKSCKFIILHGKKMSNILMCFLLYKMSAVAIEFSYVLNVKKKTVKNDTACAIVILTTINSSAPDKDTTCKIFTIVLLTK